MSHQNHLHILWDTRHTGGNIQSIIWERVWFSFTSTETWSFSINIIYEISSTQIDDIDGENNTNFIPSTVSHYHRNTDVVTRHPLQQRHLLFVCICWAKLLHNKIHRILCDLKINTHLHLHIISAWYHYTTRSTTAFILIHDDVIKWKHFPRYWPFDVYLICVWNKRLSKQSWYWWF